MAGDGAEEGRAAEIAAELARELDLGSDDENLVAGLLRLGIPANDIRRAAERGRLDDAIFDHVLDPHRADRSVSLREVEEAGGMAIGDTQAVLRGLGLPAPQPDDPYFTRDEASVFIELGRGGELWPQEVRMQVSRVYGQALSHVAQTEVNVFRSRTERRLREITPGRIEALAAVRQAFGWLLPLADPILVGVHRRKIEQELTQATVWEVESEAEGLVPGSREVSLAFCDLKDFTAYANARGDAAAIQALERLTEAVEEHRGSGVVVKALGDGYMLAYPRPDDAVAAVLAIGSAMREADDIAVHAGIHHGLAVFREGDYFGRAVNLASRLLATAGAGELAATEDVAVSTPAYPWRERGRRKLRGFDEPHEIYALDLESAPKQSRPG